MLALLAVVAGVSLAEPALAQPAADTQALVSQGIAKFDARDYDGARALFQKAYATSPEPKILLDLALAELNGGHPLDALSHMKQFVRDPHAAPDKVEAVSHDLIPQAYKQTGHLGLRAPAGTALAVDGQSLPQPAPLSEPVDVTAGAHKVAFGGAGGKTMDVDARAGEVTTLTYVLPAPPPLPNVRPQPEPLAASHEAALRRTFWTANHVLAIGLGVGALAAAGVGAYFAVKVGSDGDDATTLRASLPASSSCVSPSAANAQACTNLQNAVNAQSSDRSVSTALFVGGGVLLVGAVATWLIWPSAKSKSSQGLAVHPLLLPSFGGFYVDAAF